MNALAFEALLEKAGLDEALRARLALYGSLVLEGNRRFNLTGAKSTEEFVAHLLDSLTVVPYVVEPYIDLGSGAGLPVIPVAIATGLPVTMVESTAKKAAFLLATAERLGLRVSVVAERAEIAAHQSDLRERFASGTARAVGAAPTVAELLLPFMRIGGLAILQRGSLPEAERTALADASLMLGGAVEAEIRLAGERRVILLRKGSPTPERFPRRAGVPAKRPLCIR